MARLFGTDGVRGIANDSLTPEMALALGRAAAHVLGPQGTFLVGRDTRVSGPMLEAALVAGLCSAGARAVRTGVVPTPAVAYLTRALGASAGAVISASHNPIEDNGIKFFGSDGRKLPEHVEDAVEAALQGSFPRPVGVDVGVPTDLVDAEERYLRFLVQHAPRVSGLRVVVDCAYGAAYRVAPKLWSLLGAQVVALHHEPDGRRINVGCGSTHPEVLQRAVREHGADVGFAHDGDADRVIAVDERGQVVDGDLILTVCAHYLRAQGRLNPPAVVVTVMTNLGVERFLREKGVEVVRAPVGDRYVLERMEALGVVLGGEQSGHVIFRHLSTTGDGLLTAVQLVSAMVYSGKPLSQLVGQVPRYPQVLRNVPVPSRVRDRIVEHPAVFARLEDAKRRAGGRGRVLVRPSGTEPVVRVMVEHEDLGCAEQLAEELVACIQQAAQEVSGGTA